MEDELDMVPTKEKSTKSNLSSRSVKSSNRKVPNQPTYRTDRVKSSIPKPSNYKAPGKHDQPTKYLEELKKKELERTIK